MFIPIMTLLVADACIQAGKILANPKHADKDHR